MLGVATKRQPKDVQPAQFGKTGQPDGFERRVSNRSITMPGQFHRDAPYTPAVYTSTTSQIVHVLVIIRVHVLVIIRKYLFGLRTKSMHFTNILLPSLKLSNGKPSSLSFPL